MSEQYGLHLANKPKCVALQHPKTGAEVYSWTYLVSHVTKGFFGRVKAKETFDFAALKIYTIDVKTSRISKIENFDDAQRIADVNKASAWLDNNNPGWYLPHKDAIYSHKSGYSMRKK
jgi:hypothetical protein